MNLIILSSIASLALVNAYAATSIIVNTDVTRTNDAAIAGAALANSGVATLSTLSSNVLFEPTSPSTPASNIGNYEIKLTGLDLSNEDSAATSVNISFNLTLTPNSQQPNSRVIVADLNNDGPQGFTVDSGALAEPESELISNTETILFEISNIQVLDDSANKGSLKDNDVSFLEFTNIDIDEELDDSSFTNGLFTGSSHPDGSRVTGVDFTLQAVPEPSSAMLFSLTCLAALIRRKR